MDRVRTYRKLTLADKINDYKVLIKFRLTLMVVFSAVMSYLILGGSSVSWLGALSLSIGGILVAGAANTLNQVLEKDYDILMERTRDRPVAAGRMSVSEAVMAAGLMSVLGVSILALFNPLTAFLGMLSLLVYAFVYTPLKRFSTIAVIVGAFPGALPVLIGGTAIEGHISVFALILFGIQFFWQLPHFWAIGWLGYEDYSKAGYKMIKEKTPVVGLQSIWATVPLILLSVLPVMFGNMNFVFVVIAASLGFIYSVYSWNFYKNSDRLTARKLMFCSFFYLPLILLSFYLGVAI